MKLDATAILTLAGVGCAGFLAWKIYGLASGTAGGVAGVAASVGAGAVQAVGGAASGTVGAIGASVGLPTPQQTTTDATVARWLIDNAGHFEASKWAGAPAYLRAVMLPAGSGTPPPANSEAGQAFAGLLVPDTGDETARLLARYPNPNAPAIREPSGIFDGAGSFGEGAALPAEGFGGLWTGPGYFTGIPTARGN